MRILVTETLFAHALIFATVRLLATAITINLHEDTLSTAYILSTAYTLSTACTV
jgi:hypothetical protein